MIKDFENKHEAVLIEIANIIEHSNLTRDVSKQVLYERIAQLITELEAEANEVIPYQIALEYLQAHDDASEQLGIKAVMIDSKGQFTAQTMKQVHVEAIESIMMDAMLDLTAAYRTFEMNAITSIEDTLEEVKAELLKAQFMKNKDYAKRKVMKAFREKGMTSFITRDGKRLPLDFYASTVVETKLAQANVKGHIQRYEEADVELVQIQSRPGTCEHCAAHNGMVYAFGQHDKYPELTDETEPPYHPHCKCTLVPIIEDYLTESEQKEIDERIAKGVKYDSRTKAERELYEREQRINRRNNAEKKLFIRMQEHLGADMPVSLPAFRRMKRANTSKYQELYSNYLSATHTKRGNE